MNNINIDKRIASLIESAKAVGRTEQRIALMQHGEIHLLSPDIPESELVAALNAAGLALTAVDGGQLIHRVPA